MGALKNNLFSKWAVDKISLGTYVLAGCFLYRAWEAILIGVLGGAIASASVPLLDKMRVDDPVSASAVHGASGLWGVIAVGLFADNPIPMDTTNGRSGLFKGGGWYLLGVQTLTGVCLMAWGALVTMALLWLIDRVLPIRMDPYEELLGADLTDHKIRHAQVGVSRAVSALRPYHRSHSIEEVGGIGVNTGHNLVVDKLKEIQKKKKGKLNENLKIYTNNGFVDDSVSEPSTFKNNGFLNKRPGNPENDLHRALDSMENDINGKTFKTKSEPKCSTITVIPEDLKGKKFKELSVNELEQLGEMNASQERFRYRYTEDDYKNDLDRAAPVMTWID